MGLWLQWRETHLLCSGVVAGGGVPCLPRGNLPWRTLWCLAPLLNLCMNNFLAFGKKALALSLSLSSRVWSHVLRVTVQMPFLFSLDSRAQSHQGVVTHSFNGCVVFFFYFYLYDVELLTINILCK